MEINFKYASKKMSENWYGLLIAYFVILILCYLIIWQAIEPMGIPDKIESGGNSRLFYHLIVTFLVASHLTLMLDLFLRWKKRNSFSDNEYSNFLIGDWQGDYRNHKDKKRDVTLSFYEEDKEFKATIKVDTDEGELLQFTSMENFSSDITFDLRTTEFKQSAERKTKWRPELWKCELIKNPKTNTEKVKATITDVTSSGVEREITTFNLYRKK